MVEWLKRRDCDRHGLVSKPTCAILLCPYKRHFMALSPCLVVLTSSSKFQLYLYKTKKTRYIELQSNSNMLVFPEAGRGNCLPMY